MSSIRSESGGRERLVPQAVQLTREQVDWLDARALRNQTFSRAAEVRGILQAAMDGERLKEEVLAA